ncbi:MAG: hypothetical protein HY054_06310 [Proteobacteria bacterium]|nr:hypothetical protein [Pseudomonadota bacterium]
MDIKLESQRGEVVHAAPTAFDADPPDVVLWCGRTYRFVRTDGIFDQKKHVYREASVHDLGGVPQDGAGDGSAEHTVNGAGAASAPEAAPLNGKKPKDDRQVSATLTAAQAALLKRVKARGAYASPKATIIAGLEALDEKHALSNDALLKLLAERLDDTRH